MARKREKDHQVHRSAHVQRQHYLHTKKKYSLVRISAIPQCVRQKSLWRTKNMWGKSAGTYGGSQPSLLDVLLFFFFLGFHKNSRVSEDNLIKYGGGEDFCIVHEALYARSIYIYLFHIHTSVPEMT